MNANRRLAFTLIEVLIVVVIMAILAGAVLPQLANSTKDAREASLRYNLTALRTQIDAYKTQHQDSPPNMVDSFGQLRSATNIAGAISPTGQVTAEYPIGPYRQGNLPPQPFSGLSTVRAADGSPGTTPTALPAPGGGWIYRATTGEIWADHPDYVGW